MAPQVGIIHLIKSYAGKQATGALFMKLGNDKLLQIFFVQGEIQSIKYQGLHGMDIVRQMGSFEAVRAQFHEGAVSRKIDELPATADIIDMIENNNFSNVVPSDQFVGISEQQRSIIESIFTDYVGPIANIIFAEELEHSNSAMELVKNLSRQMDDAKEQSRFQSDAMAALKK